MGGCESVHNYLLSFAPPASLPRMPESKVTSDSASEVIGTRHIDLRDQQAPKLARTDPSGSNCVGSTIQVQLGFRYLTRLCWRCWGGRKVVCWKQVIRETCLNHCPDWCYQAAIVITTNSAMFVLNMSHITVLIDAKRSLSVSISTVICYLSICNISLFGVLADSSPSHW